MSSECTGLFVCDRAGRRAASCECGTALFTVLLVMTLFAAIAGGLVVVVRVESLLAVRHRQSAEARFAAEAGIEAVVSELRNIPDWSVAVAGIQQSPLSQGTFLGAKRVPGGDTVTVCCARGSAAERLASETLASPVPARRAIQWRPYLWAPLDDLAPGDPASRLYLVVWVANDEADAAGGAATDTNDTLIVRAEAFGPGGLRRTVEALVGRQPATGGPFLPEAASEAARVARVAVLHWQ